MSGLHQYSVEYVPYFTMYYTQFFFLQLQCKKFNAYNVTDHLIFLLLSEPGSEKAESRKYVTKAKPVCLTCNPWKKTFSDCFQLNYFYK